MSVMSHRATGLPTIYGSYFHIAARSCDHIIYTGTHTGPYANICPLPYWITLAFFSFFLAFPMDLAIIDIIYATLNMSMMMIMISRSFVTLQSPLVGVVNLSPCRWLAL